MYGEEGKCWEININKKRRYIDANLSPKYKRYVEKINNTSLIGSDFLANFHTWETSYWHSKQTVLGNKLNKKGYVEYPDTLKRIKGLGCSAVLLTLLGKTDRSNTNWGLVETSTHLQVTLIDFGYGLSELSGSDPNQNNEGLYNEPSDIIKSVFEQFKETTEPPLPPQIVHSKYIKSEVFETIEALHQIDFKHFEELANAIFAHYPRYKAAVLNGIALSIERLYNKFCDDKMYIAVQFINRCFNKFPLPLKLSSLDDSKIDYLLKRYEEIKVKESPFNEVLFMDILKSVLNNRSLKNEDVCQTQSSDSQMSIM